MPGLTTSVCRTPRFDVSHAARMAVLAAALLAGCGGGGAGSVEPAHPWIRPPHNMGDDMIAIAPWMVYRVASPVLGEAVEELRDVSYVQVSPGMASHYAGQDVRVPAEARPFLVRGLDGGASEMTVMQSASALWVRASAGEGEDLREQPLVVLLDPTPTGIFVTVDAPE